MISSLSEAGFNTEIYILWKVLLIKSDYQIVAKDIVEKNPKIIGFSTWCFSYPSAILIAKAIKALSPELPVVFGGPQASILDEETMKEYPFIDFILKGEADESLIKLLKYILSNGKNHDISQIEGLTYRIPGKKKKIMHNGGYGFIENLDSLPIPSSGKWDCSWKKRRVLKF